MSNDKKIDEILYLTRELSYATKFHDSIKGSFIPDNMPFSLRGGAIDYACAYVLFRAINQCQPRKMLELGMGQSTKIFMSYIDSRNETGFVHRVVEHDSEWISFFTKTNPISEKTEIVKLELEIDDISINNRDSHTYFYKNFSNAIGDMKYDLVFVDGPYGWNNPVFSRIDYARLLPDILPDSFVIIIHDITRPGEKNTFSYMKQVIDDSNIACHSAVFLNTGMIVSDDNRFLCHI